MRRIQYSFRFFRTQNLAYLVLLPALLFGGMVHAQDTLPSFSLKNAGNNRIIIGWTNKFQDIRQISIQRSHDSLKGYKTLLTVPDPTTPQNGYVDTKAPVDNMFYRLYIMLDKGIFLFSIPKRPQKDTLTYTASGEVIQNDTIRMGDTFIVAKPFGVNLDKFPATDSVAVPKVNNNKPRPNAFTPSLYVFTYRDGYVRVKLPEAEDPKKYAIKFFEDDGTFLFELKEIREKDFRIDKANFYHSGWFRFELYEDGKLIEKHKFILEKDF